MAQRIANKRGVADRILKATRFLSKLLIALFILIPVISVLFAVFVMHEPTGGTGVDSPLEVFPVSTVTGTSGILLVRPGQKVTAAYIVKNTTRDASVSRRVGISAAGPDVCKLDWKASANGFGAKDYIVLKPGESMRFEGTQTYTELGLYFMETNRQTMDGLWGGFGRRVDRQYFIVGDESTMKSVDTSCVDNNTKVIGEAVLLKPTPQSTPQP